MRRAGAGDDVGRADRAVATARPRRSTSPSRGSSPGSANPAPKLATVIAGHVRGRGLHRRRRRGAQRRDEDAVRRRVRALDGGNVVAGVHLRSRPPTGIGAARAPGGACVERVDLLPGADQRVFIDIDSLLRPVYGHAKQGASYGHTKIAGKQILRKGLSPLATTISTPGSAPVIAGMRLRAGQDQLRQGRRTDGRPGHRHRPRRRRQRPDSGARRFGLRQPRGRGAPADAHGAQFSLVMTRNTAIDRAIAAIDERRLDTGALSRRGASIPTPGTGSLMPKSPKSPTPLSRPPRIGSPPAWWCAGSKTPASATRCSRCGGITRSSPTPTSRSTEADITHRQHAIIETVFADLIDGPLAHIPSGRFGANSAWILCAAIAHNLLRAAGVLAGDQHTPRPRIDAAPQDRHHPRPAGPPPTPTDPAPTHPLALVTDTGLRCGTTPSATAHQPAATL